MPNAKARRIGKKIEVELTLRGPLLTKSSSTGPWGVDAVCARNSDGHLYIPGSQVKGKFREALDQLGVKFSGGESRSRREEMEKLAHKDQESSDTAVATFRQTQLKQLEENRKPFEISFTDFVCHEDTPGPGINTMTRVRIDEETNAAQTGALRILDCPVTAGQYVKFKGCIRYMTESNEDDKKELILKSLRWISGFGSDQNVGYGKLMNVVELGETTVQPTPVPSSTPVQPSADLSLTFEDYLCFPNGVVNGNIYESQNTISGAVILGSMANSIKEFLGLPLNADISTAGKDDSNLGQLCKHFNNLVVLEARPTKESRPTVAPQSLVWANNQFFDMVKSKGEPDEFLLNDEAPAYSPDWKGATWAELSKLTGETSPRQELRVRTAIDSRNRRSLDSNLFAYRGLNPKGVQWRSRITLKPGVDATDDERGQVFSQLESLLSTGWLQFGKTKSRGTGTLTHQPLKDCPDPVEVDGKACFVVCLQSDTLMLDPRQLPDYQDLDSLDAQYLNYWNSISTTEASAPNLFQTIPKRRFASHRLIGGYQAYRYRFKPSPENTDQLTRENQSNLPYNATLLTAKGSVFVLACDSDRQAEAKEELTKWLNYGLPVPEWARDAYGETFETNPFLPDNGFGEIAVNSFPAETQ